MAGSVTSKHIAAELGISQSTVSRVLNGKDRQMISDRTRERVMQAAEEMGYTPNRFARALVTGRTGVIALALPELRSPFFAWIAESACARLRRMGYEVLLQVDMSEETSDQTPHPPTCPVDAVLGWTSVASTGILGAVIREHAVPLVRIGLAPEQPGETDSVLVDLEPAVRDAIGSLLKSGRKHTCFLTSPVMDSKSEERQAVYLEMMQEAGSEPEVIVADHYHKTAVYEAVLSRLGRRPEVDAMFCLSDYYALAAHAAIRKIGRRIPEDVALIGCDGIEDGTLTDPPLSTIVMPGEEMVSLACRTLQDRLDSPDSPPKHQRVTADFVCRGTS